MNAGRDDDVVQGGLCPRNTFTCRRATHTIGTPPLYYSVPQNFVVFALFHCSTKLRSILIPLLLRVVYIPQSNTIDVSCQ